MSSNPGAAAPEADTRTGSGLLAGRPWGAVVLLMLLIVLNYLDRFLPSILAETIKRDLGLSDTFLGLLNGLGFLAVYAIAGIPIARLSDSGRYGTVISASVGLWSLMTSLGGFVATGWQLAFTRIGVAIGEAGSIPAAQAYVSRNFPQARRTVAMGVLSLGAPLGVMTSLAAGGIVGELLGWRRAFIVMGVLGLCVAPLVLLLLGPGRPIPQTAEAVEGGAVRAMAKPSIAALLAATGFVSMGGYTMTAFAPAFLMRVHGMSVSAAGVKLGIANGAIGAVGVFAMAWVAQRLARRDRRHTLGLLIAVAIVCTPIAAAAFLVADGSVATVLIGMSFVLANGYLALTISCLHSLVPAPLRARMSAVFIFCSAVFGGLGPLFTGMISDALHAELGAAALGRAMLIVPVSYALAALSYAAAVPVYRRDLLD